MRDSLVFVLHIRDAMEDIRGFTSGGREEFLASRKTQWAVMRGVEIIGEAAKNVPPGFRDQWPRVPWKAVAGFRDVLIHAYDRVDPELVWGIVERDLPALREAIAEIVKAHPELPSSPSVE